MVRQNPDTPFLAPCLSNPLVVLFPHALPLFYLGIITTFAVVAGGIGGKLSVDTILILGFSSVVADAISMGVGDALSTKSENEYILAERDREAWEFKNNPEGEIEEMVDLYVQKGCEREDAQIIVEKMAKYKEFFINVMMAEELELQVPDEDDNPWIDGGVTFLSFVFFGTIPLLAFAVLYGLNLSLSDQFLISCVLTGLALFGLGVVKSKFTKKHWTWAGMEVFSLGS
jgi:DNA damage-binding protein 1